MYPPMTFTFLPSGLSVLSPSFLFFFLLRYWAKDTDYATVNGGKFDFVFGEPDRFKPSIHSTVGTMMRILFLAHENTASLFSFSCFLFVLRLSLHLFLRSSVHRNCFLKTIFFLYTFVLFFCSFVCFLFVCLFVWTEGRGGRPSGIPISAEFWDYLMRSSKAWGLVTYEQDWLDTTVSTVAPPQPWFDESCR